ncbi:MAG: hypothetical protein V7K67_00100 [Nostoc sp.]|uniref:hypothetical protein n=1 Tax=Nostoc sp. TaxID=1180 RepID=UPI002FEFE3BE
MFVFDELVDLLAIASGMVGFEAAPHHLCVVVERVDTTAPPAAVSQPRLGD